MDADRIEALRQALDAMPDNNTLRLLLAETLEKAGFAQEAVAEYRVLLEAGQLDQKTLIAAGKVALDVDDLELASRCLDAAVQAGAHAGVAELRSRLDEKLESQGYLRVVVPPGNAGSSGPWEVSPETVTFADVGGLDNVKKIIHKRIILPLLRPDVYQRYGRASGGGVLLYGPPGCGKTMLARATAGECKLPFLNVRIEEILDPYMGVSERNLHAAFTQARAQAPCVLFLDELDAVAYSRRKRVTGVGRSLVDQLLQELDAIGADNQQVLILAATNAPWDLDDALLRPGRFDRRVFVPPPDQEARQEILKRLLRGLPAEKPPLEQLARETPLFSGADLRALVEDAIDRVIDEALEHGGQPPLTADHLEAARAMLRPTTLDWLERAHNYVEFANQDKRYDDVARYLSSREVRRRKR
ncbi:MAG: ATP-binding protein [Candidatus Promineifilaceae bacterium]|nr:ATP-binding protein [Candidatus Promineifilaceae bacterium]